MKEILIQYAAYNLWANQRLTSLVLNLDEAKQEASVASSFPGLKQTLLHVWDAENMWWQRMKLYEKLVRPSALKQYNTKEIVDELLQQDKEWVDWISSASDIALDHVFAYQNTRKEQFKQPIYQMLLHVFNHSTYHRGQIVTMLHHLNVDKIPSTDFIEWIRGAKRQ